MHYTESSAFCSQLFPYFLISSFLASLLPITYIPHIFLLESCLLKTAFEMQTAEFSLSVVLLEAPPPPR